MKTTASDILIDAIHDWGVEVVFGLPGDGINGIMEALRKRSDKIRFIQVRHEEAAAFMACGYAKYTGKLGVCLATSGPGGLHLLNGLYDAKLDGAPVLAITGLQYHDLVHTYTQQDVELDKVFLDDETSPPVRIAAGEYGYDSYYFLRMAEAGAVDVLQADATRCGGITGFLKAAEIADAYHLPLSAHTAPALHLHVCCSVQPAINVEYFHDHVRIENVFFDGVMQPVNGKLYPDLSRSGNGLEFKRADALRFAA